MAERPWGFKSLLPHQRFLKTRLNLQKPAYVLAISHFSAKQTEVNRAVGGGDQTARSHIPNRRHSGIHRQCRRTRLFERRAFGFNPEAQSSPTLNEYPENASLQIERERCETFGTSPQAYRANKVRRTSQAIRAELLEPQMSGSSPLVYFTPVISLVILSLRAFINSVRHWSLAFMNCVRLWSVRRSTSFSSCIRRSMSFIV